MQKNSTYKIQYAGFDLDGKYCEYCRNKISKIDLVLSEVAASNLDGEIEISRYHSDCFLEVKKNICMNQLENLENIRYAHQREILLKLSEGKGKLKNLNDKKRKHDEGNDEKISKISEILTWDEQIEEIISKQTEDFFRIRDSLRKCEQSDLHYLLIMNDCEIFQRDEEDLLDFCAEILNFGLVDKHKKCEKCDNGEMIFMKFGYFCNAWIDDWIKCESFDDEIKRKKCTIPDELKGHKVFKQMTPKIENRVIRTKYENSCEVNSYQNITKDPKKFVEVFVKNEICVNPDFDMCRETQVYCYGNSVYSCTLTLVDIEKNKNNFFKMQILISNTEPLNLTYFYFFKSWGQTGSTTKSSNTVVFQSFDKAKAEFELIFKDKTGYDWNSRGKMRKIPYKYFYVEENFNIRNQPSKNYVDLRNDDLLRQLYHAQSLENVVKNMFVDLQKMPLGKLSSKQCHQGFSVLSELKEALESEKPQNIIKGLSNKFYSMIPQFLDSYPASILDSATKVEQQKEFVKELMENIQEIPISELKSQLNADIELLEINSEEHSLIMKYIKNSSVDDFEIEVIDIFKIERHEEVERYLPYKTSPNRRLLWHGSPLINILSIIQKGLIPPYPKKCGIFFADVASKSAKYCQESNSFKILTLCEVALGNMKEIYKGHCNFKFIEGFQSTKTVGTFEPNPNESVIVDDGVLIPLGKLVKTTPENPDIFNSYSQLHYNEYIVDNKNQIKLRYLIKFNQVNNS